MSSDPRPRSFHGGSLNYDPSKSDQSPRLFWLLRFFHSAPAFSHFFFFLEHWFAGETAFIFPVGPNILAINFLSAWFSWSGLQLVAAKNCEWNTSFSGPRLCRGGNWGPQGLNNLQSFQSWTLSQLELESQALSLGVHAVTVTVTIAFNPGSSDPDILIFHASVTILNSFQPTAHPGTPGSPCSTQLSFSLKLWP
jgi:hypothetical protein